MSPQVISLVGLLSLTGLCVLFSTDRKAINYSTVLWGLGLQIFLAIAVLGIPALGWKGPLSPFFQYANDGFLALLSFTEEGSRFLFGPLVAPDKVGGFVFALVVLPSVIFMSALMAIAYHLGLMQWIVRVLAYLMQKTMRVSGAEALSTAANIFVGQTEAPLLIKPYINKMTRSEIFTIMLGGMANVAGGVLAAYVGLLHNRIPDIAGHLLTTSVLSAPAALLVAKILIPERERTSTGSHIPSIEERPDQSLIEAAARGAQEGLGMALNIAAMLIVFIALIAFANSLLTGFGNFIGFKTWAHQLIPDFMWPQGSKDLTLQLIFGWLFFPVTLLIGVPLSDAASVGGLLGEKIVLNEFVSYMHLADIAQGLSDRGAVLASYALCGFANFSSIGVQVGGIGALAPNKQAMIASLGIRCVLGATVATLMTAATAGILI